MPATIWAWTKEGQEELTVSDDDLIADIIEKAHGKMRIAQRGMRGQTMMPQDSADWWIAKEALSRSSAEIGLAQDRIKDLERRNIRLAAALQQIRDDIPPNEHKKWFHHHHYYYIANSTLEELGETTKDSNHSEPTAFQKANALASEQLDGFGGAFSHLKELRESEQGTHPRCPIHGQHQTEGEPCEYCAMDADEARCADGESDDW